MDPRVDAYPTGPDAMDLDLSLDEIIARRKNRWPGLPVSSSSYPTDLPDPCQYQPPNPPIDARIASERTPGMNIANQTKKQRRKADKRREGRKRKKTAKAADQMVPSIAHRYVQRSHFRPQRDAPPHLNPSSQALPSHIVSISCTDTPPEVAHASQLFHTLPPDQKGHTTVKSVYIGPFPVGTKVAEVKGMMELCIGTVKEARAVSQGGKSGQFWAGSWVKVEFVGGKGWKAYKKFNGTFLDESIPLEVIPIIMRP